MESSNTEQRNTNLLSNTWWILVLNFKHAPVIATARIISYVINSTSALLKAFVVGLIIDWVLLFVNGPHDQSLVFKSLFVFGAYYVLSTIGGVCNNYANNLIGFKMGYELPKLLLHQKLSKLGSATLEAPAVQNLITRYNESGYVFESLSKYLFIVIAGSISLLAALLPLLPVLPLTTLMLVLASIPGLLISRNVIHRLWRLDQDSTVLSRRASSLIGMINSPSTLKEIKLLNAYTYLKRYFEEYVASYFGQKLKIYNRWIAYDILSGLITGGVMILGIYQLIQLASEGNVSVGQITFLIAALLTVNNYIDNLTSNFTSYVSTNHRAAEARELLALPEPNNTGKTIIPKLTGAPHLKLENVSFKYPNSENLVIKGLNLEIKPGEKLAIVGENGAGKTTLVKLLSNIYPVTSGKILVDGKDLNTIEANSWFKNLGVLYQDYNTYDDLTVFENIALGRIDEELNYELVKEAAKKADAYDFIMDYQDNFSQVLSERYEGGTRPSTGQWQKLAIARFFYRNAPVLILDEPTASIDAVAEANIFNRIYQFIENKTVIIVSHRFSTVRNADRIIVFDHGQIIEEGSHEQLIQKGGKYAKAFRLQAEGYQK